jgi:CDP-diacylglycerol--glycerol-3-phosphate 3-phosphatidyltransferase
VYTLPTLLTWLRILVIPVLVGLYYVSSSVLDPHVRDIAATSLFIAAAITDWVDGWLARKTGQTSSFGAFLDPVADKLLVCSALLLLLELHRVDGLIALIIIGREITISALREWMANLGKSANVAVNSLGKMKTIAQLVAIPMLLFHAPLFGLFDTGPVGTVLIIGAAILTVWSMVYYLWLARAHFAAA